MKDNLGDRMKEYEGASSIKLTKRIPVVIRLDGKAFHTLTRGMDKPYDTELMSVMQSTMKFLCKNIQGCKIGYTQSDEITLLLTDYDTLETDAWFGYKVQKMCSVAASIATLEFNRQFRKTKYTQKYDMAMFDARVFNLPKEEVCNCFVWRQKDATRNAIQLLGQSKFSQNQLNKKSCKDIQNMLIAEYGINFSNERTDFRRGSCCYKVNGSWIVDTEIPAFTEDREFINRWVML